MAKKKRKGKGNPWALLVPLVLLFFLLVFFNIKIWQERSETREHYLTAKMKLERLLEEEEYLEKAEEEEIDIERELERIAREQLLLKKEGEEVVLISRREEKEDEKAKEDMAESEEEKGFLERLRELLPL